MRDHGRETGKTKRYYYKNIIVSMCGGLFSAVYATQENHFLLTTGHKTKKEAIQDGKKQLDFLNTKEGR